MSDAQFAPDFSPMAPPYGFIQWKGTDICFDFHCECGAHRHFDGRFAYAVRCPECNRLWIMPHSVALRPAPDDYSGVEIGFTDHQHDWENPVPTVRRGIG